MARIDKVSRALSYPPLTVFNALTDGSAVARWLPPQGMGGQVRVFEPWNGGSVEIVLTYLDARTARGKTDADHDRILGTVTEVVPEHRFRFAVRFISEDPAFAGTMTMVWQIEPTATGCLLIMAAENVPRGISAADHRLGMSSSLANLQRYLEHRESNSG